MIQTGERTWGTEVMKTPLYGWGLAFVASLAAIVKGADWFTDGAVKVARATGIPEVIVGATIVSVATTLPEFTVSSLAAWGGHPGLAFGNAVGSALGNIGFILALACLIRPFRIKRGIFLFQGFFMFLAGTTLFFLAVDARVSRADGLVLVTLLGVVLLCTIVVSRSAVTAKPRRVEGGKRPGPGLYRSHGAQVTGPWHHAWCSFLVGAGLVIGGSRVLVASGEYLARLLGIPELVIGLTLVAMGTSLPELVTSLVSTLKGYQGLSVGNIIGANTLDLTWVVFGATLFGEVSLSAQTIFVDLPMMLLFFAGLLFFGLTGGRLERWEGLVLFMAYAFYVGILFGLVG